MKNKTDELLARAKKAYGHKPSMAELTSYMLYEQAANAKSSSKNDAGGSHSHFHDEDDVVLNSTLEKAQNALSRAQREEVRLQESALYQAAQRLEADIAHSVIEALNRGDFDTIEELVSSRQNDRFVQQFVTVLMSYYLVLYPMYAKQLMHARAGEMDQQGVFSMTEELESLIRDQAMNAAESHVSTVLDDIYKALDDVADKVARDSLVELVTERVHAREGSIMDLLPERPTSEDILKAVHAGTFDDHEIYAEARRLARQGGGLDEMTRAVRKKYGEISKNRARTIARHETNRVFNMAQYQADIQFLTESGLMGRAYKVMRNRANDPCPYCAKVIAESRANPIPFEKNFIDLGGEITANFVNSKGQMTVRKMPINYEPITAGNIHVNCRCEYELIIKNEDGTYMNELDLRVYNRGYNPYRDTKTGRFTFGAGKKPAQSTGKSGIKKTVLRGMVDSAKKNGGMTTNTTGNSPSEGIAFAPRKDTETIISSADFNEKSLDKFVDTHMELLSQKGMHIGGWFNSEDGNWYLDISKVGGYNSNTIKEAQDAEQLAVFDLKTFNEIKTGDIVDGKYIKAGEPEAIFDSAYGGRDKRGVQNSTQENSTAEAEEKVENRGHNPYRDMKSGEFTFGPNKSSSGNGVVRGKNTSVSSVAEFKTELQNRNFGRVSIDLGDEIIKNGHAQVLLETIDSMPEHTLNMISGHNKKLALEYQAYPHKERANRRYTRGMYNGTENRIRLYYDTRNPEKTPAQRVRATMVHEMVHAADFGQGVQSVRNKQGKYFRKYVEVSKLPVAERASYIDSLTHGVKNAKEFYANTMTSYILETPTSKTKKFQEEIVPIIENHIKGADDE